jgi:hypothetical protein
MRELNSSRDGSNLGNSAHNRKIKGRNSWDKNTSTASPQQHKRQLEQQGTPTTAGDTDTSPETLATAGTQGTQTAVITTATAGMPETAETTTCMPLILTIS